MKRRDALRTIIATATAPLFVPARVMGANAPSKRITLGCIGMGSQGTHANLSSFLHEADAQVTAVCDAFADRTENARRMVAKQYGGNGCRVYSDFRNIIADKSIDAVVISTPDHWHVPMSLLALAAGKDVFCEKPTHTIAEGRSLITAVKTCGAVFQVGLEDRSLIYFHKMIEWIRNGAIGDLQRIDVSLPCGIDRPREDPAPVPEGLSYDLWLGPAPFKPYTPNRTAAMHWRFISDYGNGSLVDWGSHLIDTAQLGADAPGVCPVEVEGEGTIPTDSMSDVPVAFEVHYRYANGVEMHVRSGSSPSGDGRSASIRFEGTKGWISQNKWNDRLQASDEAILHTKYTPETSRHWQLPPREQRNFLDCVKSRKPTTYTAGTMHLLGVTLHMGIAAIRLGRKLKWDPKAEAFIGDAEANAIRSRPVRKDWRRAS